MLKKKKRKVVLCWDLDSSLTSVCPCSSLCSSAPVLSQFSKSFIHPPAQLSLFCQRNTVEMKSWEEVEGGKDQPTRKNGRERKVMILVSNKLVNVFSSEEMNDFHKKKQKRMWIQSFLKSVEVIMGSKMLIRNSRQLFCVQSCNTAVTFSNFLLYSLFKKTWWSYSFSCPSGLSLKASDKGTLFGLLGCEAWNNAFILHVYSLIVMMFLDFQYKLFTSDSLCFVRISSPCWFSCSSFQIPSKKPNSCNSLL